MGDILWSCRPLKTNSEGFVPLLGVKPQLHGLGISTPLPRWTLTLGLQSRTRLNQYARASH